MMRVLVIVRTDIFVLNVKKIMIIMIIFFESQLIDSEIDNQIEEIKLKNWGVLL